MLMHLTEEDLVILLKKMIADKKIMLRDKQMDEFIAFGGQQTVKKIAKLMAKALAEMDN